MALSLSRYLRYFSIFILIVAILYKYEITLNKKTLLVTKSATLPYNRSHVYKIITNIEKYTSWYPNVAGVEHISAGSSGQVERYRLITKLPLYGKMSSILIVEKKDQPKQFIYSVNSWLREINSIELKIDPKNSNSTRIEWTVYTKHVNLLFQYILFPFAKFYKNQLVREALFTLVLQIRYF